MKTRKQKVISRILTMVVSILLLASFLVLPVSAADELETYEIENQIYEYGYSPEPPDPELKEYSSLKIVYDDHFDNLVDYTSDDMEDPDSVTSDGIRMTFTFDMQDDHAFLYYFVDTFIWYSENKVLSPDDTLFVNEGFLLVNSNSKSFIIDSCRFVVRNNASNYFFDFDDVVAATDIFTVNSSGPVIHYPQMMFTIYDTIPRDNLALCLEFSISRLSDSDSVVDFNVSKFTIRYGVGKSPNYPIYPAAPGGDQIAGLGSAEQELLDSSAAGLDEGISIMGNIGNWLGNARSSGLDLVMFTANFNAIMNSLIEIPGLNALIMISLSLGLFGSLFGLAGSIISAADRRSGQAKRDAERDTHKK